MLKSVFRKLILSDTWLDKMADFANPAGLVDLVKKQEYLLFWHILQITFSGESVKLWLLKSSSKDMPMTRPLYRRALCTRGAAKCSPGVRDKAVTVIGASAVHVTKMDFHWQAFFCVHILSAAAINWLHSNHKCCPVNRDSGSQVWRISSASGFWRCCFFCSGGPVCLRLS